MASTEGGGFPNLPEDVTSLSDVAERMVAPYIPFMQIKPLLPFAINPQLSLAGSIVNISVDINEMLKILPRKFDQLSTIQIQLKRHILHKSYYMYETISPQKVMNALKYLIRSDLYVKNQITVDQNYIKEYETKVDRVDFIVESEENQDDQCNAFAKTCSEESNIDTGEINPEDTIEGDNNEEILLIDRNEKVCDDIVIIAPGQEKKPLPWHRIENFDELCFPRLFGGHQLDRSNKLTYSQRVKYEIRHRDRRSCNPTRLLFMAKKKLEMSVASCINTCLRKTLACFKLRAKHVKDKNFVDHLIRQDEGYKFLRQIRSSPAYWDNVKKRVFASIRQLKLPHIYFTFSATETKNPDLLRILYKLRYEKNISLHEAMHLDMAMKTKLIRDDPVTCVRYIDNRFRKIIRILEHPDGPFKEHFVVDHFSRNEFQARGSMHQSSMNLIPNPSESAVNLLIKLQLVNMTPLIP
ncbi:hypothetical protein QAD02_012785 [Eretmocerus hayati]|uniref:Uncharacterized protein n=1 Tax=Eretmocerus hayati TaxID=131215 RepID=A0ACC2P1M6_9HYME|nr:hypothetical protein QAD02_012785 [Eretmocerus hayati]